MVLKKERKRIETFGTLDDAMRKRTENRGKFGFNFQMNIKDIIKKCNVKFTKGPGGAKIYEDDLRLYASLMR